MTRVAWAALALGLMACDPGTDTEEGTELPESFLAYGTITADDGSTADVRIRKAFGMSTNGKGGIYLAANEAATCARVAEYLEDHSAPFNPHDILVGGECNMSFAWTWDEEAGWDGDSFTQEDMLRGIWSINCAMGTGDFVLETRKGFRDYYWSGTWWQGDPTIYTATVTGSMDETTTGIEFQMTEYTGNFIYDELREVFADGDVDAQGPIDSGWCPALVGTSLLHF